MAKDKGRGDKGNKEKKKPKKLAKLPAPPGTRGGGLTPRMPTPGT